MIRIKASKYNEVSYDDIAEYITKPSQIIRSRFGNGVPIRFKKFESGSIYRIYSDDSFKIFNVILRISRKEDDYFDSYIEINDNVKK